MVSIHPMLLFNSHNEKNGIHVFKVSIHPMLLFNRRTVLLWLLMLCSFNTSHVTVQPLHLPCTWLANTFQYIPCYCSTVKKFRNMSQERQFQYIPCYCSTTICRGILQHYNSFNTSHVTVQLSTFLVFILCDICFNTSHVTVQLYFYYRSRVKLSDVSIHPMLLFNTPWTVLMNLM